MEHYIGRVCCCRSPSCSLYFWLMLQRKSPAADALQEEDGRQGCVHSTQNKLVSPSSTRTCSTFIMVGTAVLFFLFLFFYAARLSVCLLVILRCRPLLPQLQLVWLDKGASSSYSTAASQPHRPTHPSSVRQRNGRPPPPPTTDRVRTDLDAHHLE